MTRAMRSEDKDMVLAMMETFYHSDAVIHSGDRTIYEKDFQACMEHDMVQGWILEDGNGQTAGYAMTAKGWSTEYACPVVWIEDLYVIPHFQGQGIGTEFLNWTAKSNPNCRIRLEAEASNGKALAVYEAAGYERIPYVQLVKERGDW